VVWSCRHLLELFNPSKSIDGRGIRLTTIERPISGPSVSHSELPKSLAVLFEIRSHNSPASRLHADDPETAL